MKGWLHTFMSTCTLEINSKKKKKKLSSSNSCYCKLLSNLDLGNLIAVTEIRNPLAAMNYWIMNHISR